MEKMRERDRGRDRDRKRDRERERDRHIRVRCSTVQCSRVSVPCIANTSDTYAPLVCLELYSDMMVAARGYMPPIGGRGEGKSSVRRERIG